MNKIFLAFLLTFCAAIPSFAQNLMTQNLHSMNMMIAMEDSQKQQQQQQIANQAPIVVQIQYQADGTPVITSSAPIQVQTVSPQIQEQKPQPDYVRPFEIILAFIFGCFVGPILTQMYKNTKSNK